MIPEKYIVGEVPSLWLGVFEGQGEIEWSPWEKKLVGTHNNDDDNDYDDNDS